ncbi:uncharacterized protein [Nicotiana tomentosiformis]|uniref:uncharacterized protein n=1 Tax=Nicotiana tomentosiformis TaxID=4098 RepID=UPI00388CD401
MGTDPREDPQDFTDQLHKIFRVMHAAEKEVVKPAAFRLRDIAVLWYEGWERSRGRGAPLVIQENFQNAFLDQYAPSIAATMRDKIHRFIIGLYPELTKACATAALQDRCESQSSAGRGRGRGRGSSSGCNQNRIYALAGRQDQESSPDVVTGNTVTPRGRFISYLKARKMIKKGCIYHIVRVRDAYAEIPTLQSIPVVREFTDAFPDELPPIPPKREIDFSIDLLMGTQPISIPPYRKAPAELKELKE